MNKLKYILTIILIFIYAQTASAQDPLSKEDAFSAEEYPDITALFENRDDAQQIIDAFTDSAGNWRNLYGAIEYFTGDKREACIYLVKIMPHLDRLEMTMETLVEHVEYAWSAKTDFPYTVPDDMFREYILIYRLGREPVTPYRAILRERFEHLVGATPSDTAKAVNEWIHENMEIKPRGFFGPRPSPTSVLSAGVGTEKDIANLTVGILKTLGVPSRRVSISNFGQQTGGAAWVEIYDGEWVPLYPDAPTDFGDFTHWEQGKKYNVTVATAQSAFNAAQVTSAYTGVGVIELKFSRQGQVIPDFKHFGISVYNNGAFLPLDDLEYPLEDTSMLTNEAGVFEAVLGDGTYLVQCGVRNYKGDPWVQTSFVYLAAGEKIRVEFEIDIPVMDLAPGDLVKRKFNELPQFKLDNLDYPSDLDGSAHLIVFFNLREEPAIRMLPDIIKFANEHPELTLKLIHTNAPDETEEAKRSVDDAGGDSLEILWDDSGEAAKAWKCAYDEDTTKFTSLPACVMVDEHGTIVLYSEDLNLIIYDYLIRGLEFIP